MSLISCPDCGKEISSTAKFCLGCGKRFRNRTLNVVGLIASILVLLVSILLFNLFGRGNDLGGIFVVTASISVISSVIFFWRI